MPGYARLTEENISIHAPREGGDDADRARLGIIEQFQSTPPARGATINNADRDSNSSISIHAPREGGDNAEKGQTKP